MSKPRPSVAPGCMEPGSSHEETEDEEEDDEEEERVSKQQVEGEAEGSRGLGAGGGLMVGYPQVIKKAKESIKLILIRAAN